MKIDRYVLQKNDTAMSAEGSPGVYASPESTSLPLLQLTEKVFGTYMQLCQSQKRFFPVLSYLH